MLHPKIENFNYVQHAKLFKDILMWSYMKLKVRQAKLLWFFFYVTLIYSVNFTIVSNMYPKLREQPLYCCYKSIDRFNDAISLNYSFHVMHLCWKWHSVLMSTTCDSASGTITKLGYVSYWAMLHGKQEICPWASISAAWRQPHTESF